MGALVRLDQLLPLMLPHLPGCDPTLHVMPTCRQMTREFFERSEAWVHTLPSQNLTYNVLTYTLTPSYDAQIRRIKEIRYTTADLIAQGLLGVPQSMSGKKFTPPSTLTLDAKPSSTITNGLEVDVILAPHLYSNEIPSELVDLWCTHIVAGTLAVLMGMKGREWSDPQGSKDNADKFESGIVQSNVDVLKGFTNADIRMATEGWLI